MASLAIGCSQEASKPASQHVLNDVVQLPAWKSDVSPPLRSLHAEVGTSSRERSLPVLYPHTSLATEPAPISAPIARTKAADPAPDTKSVTPGINFEGVGQGFTGPSGTYSVSVAPPDTNGAVGPNHYVQIVNLAFAVFNKSGTPVLGPLATNTLFSGFGGPCETHNDGDVTVYYDRFADRWVVSQFALVLPGGPSYQCVAVSTTGDPTGSYARYAFQADPFPDYPKLGVWPDAYYTTFNMFDANGLAFLGPRVCAYDRTKMLAGQPATQQCFTLSSTYASMLAANLDGPTAPPAGAPCPILALDSSNAALDLWKFHVDWTTPANTTLTGPTVLAVTPFSLACGGDVACIPQPGTTSTLDSLGDRLMNRLVYRNFGDHEVLLAAHSIVAGSSVGMRWYELRDPNGAPTVFQQGTHAPDSSYRWMGSVAMNRVGSIALGYSLSNSTSIYPSLAYTARLASDPAGTMGQGEGIMFSGLASQTGLSRWGDYSALTVDPADDCTFWYTNEYEAVSGSFNWHTRIGSFTVPPCVAGPAQVFSVTVSPSSFEGGTAATGTVLLSGAAPAGGATVSLVSSVPGVASVPASVVVPAGNQSVTFPITSVPSSTETPATITATYPSAVSVVGNLTVLASPTVSALTVSPTSVIGGATATATVTLSGAAPAGDAIVTLTSSNPSAATVPATLTIPAGTVIATFAVSTTTQTTTTSATITAAYHNTTRTASLTVTRIPSLSSLALTPASLDGGGTVTGTLTLTDPAPTGGAVISLASSNTTAAPVPPTVTIAAGLLAATFTITTTSVSANTIVTISGTYPASVTKSATLTISPPGNAAYDSALKVPRCAAVASFCDTGSNLIKGRDNMSGGPEQNTPNTLAASCIDGTAGSFHYDESIDRLAVSTTDGTLLAAGKTVRIDTTVWNYSSTSDALDLYFAPDANSPVWTAIATSLHAVLPNQTQQLISQTFVLPAATLPVIRANWRYSTTAGSCTTGSYDDRDDLVFALSGTPTNVAPTVNAGPDQTITLPASASLSGTVTDDGLPNPPGAVTIAWSTVSGPGTVTFANPAVAATTATFSVAGTYTLRLTGNDSALSSSDDIVVTINPVPPVNQAPVVNAGPDQTITLPATAILAGTASDDGLPNPPGAITITWSTVSGPGLVTFANPGVAATTASFSVAGVYTLRLTANDSALSSSDDIVVTVKPITPVNQAPTVNAGPDQTITLPATASLTGVVSDDGLPNPPATVTTTWSTVTGPGTVTFANPAAAITTATFSIAGSYTLRLTANDSALSATDDIVVTVNPIPPVNQAPVVNAGPDQTVTLPAAANLNGTVTDDGLPNPPATVTTTWSKVSGPGTVTFANAAAKVTTATFSAAGSYTLRLTASDSALSASDDMVVTVNPVPVNTAPVVNAGPDQTITLPATASLNGTVTDDGKPNPPATVTTTWSKVSGPGTVTFANASAKVTTATFSTSGSYTLRLTASDSALSASDDIVITVNPIATGPCAGLCSPPTIFTINGSYQSGNLGTGAVCYQTTSVIHGGNCSNFVSPRTLKVNGTTEACNGGNWASIPAARNGGYCIQTTTGNQSYASFALW